MAPVTPRDRSAGRASSFLFFRINFWTFQLFGRKILNQDSKTQAMRRREKRFSIYDNPLIFLVPVK